MQTSHVIFSHSVLKLRVVFFTSYLGFKVKFSIKILPVICRPKQRFLFLLMASFFLGGEQWKIPSLKKKGSWKKSLGWKFLSQFPSQKEAKLRPLFSGAKVLPFDPFFGGEVIGTSSAARMKFCWDFTMEIGRQQRGLKFWTSMIEMMFHEKTCKNASATVQVDMPKMSP